MIKDSQASWIAYRKPKRVTALRIFCFPYAGGGASVYRTWHKAFPDTVEVCPVQPPGRGTRVFEPAYPNLEPMVESLTKIMRPLLDRPFVFFGYSMGALIAFELTRALRAEHRPGPAHLFVAARRGPRVSDPYPSTKNLGDAEFLRELAKIGGTSEEILGSPDLLEMLLPTLRADFTLCENYVYLPGALLDCPITVFGAKSDLRVPGEALAAWAMETSSSCDVKMFSGDHFFIHSRQDELLQSISEILAARDLLPANRSASFITSS